MAWKTELRFDFYTIWTKEQEVIDLMRNNEQKVSGKDQTCKTKRENYEVLKGRFKCWCKDRSNNKISKR
jgi:hypothetical protein